MVDCNMHEEREPEIDGLLDDAAIEAFCNGIDEALDDVMGPKVTDYDFLVGVITAAAGNKKEMDDLVASLMQKDELVEVGVFKLAHSHSAKPEQLPREMAIQLLTSSIFAGKVFTNDPAKIAALLERRYPELDQFASKQMVSIAKSLMIEFAKEHN